MAVELFIVDAVLVHYLHGILGFCLSNDELDIGSKTRGKSYVMNSPGLKFADYSYFQLKFPTCRVDESLGIIYRS